VSTAAAERVLPARVLILGMGYSGRVLARRLQALDIHVVGTARNLDAAPADGVSRLVLNDQGPPSPALLAAVAEAEAVLCSVPPDADGDPALRVLEQALLTSPNLRWLGYLSSTSVYAESNGGVVDETTPADAESVAGVERRRAEAQWQALAAARCCGCAVFRLPALYGRGRNAMVQLAQGRARHIIRPGLRFNRLHVDDLASVVIAAMQRDGHSAIYLPTDDEPAAPQDVLAYAAQLSGLPLPPPVAWDDPAVSETLRRFYRGSKRIDGRATRAALQWQPAFPSYREGLRDAYAADHW